MPQAIQAPLGKAQAIEMLRSLASKQPRLRFEELPIGLRRAIHQHWGSMAAARKVARIPARRPGRTPTWTNERVLGELRVLARRGQHMSQSALLHDGHTRLVSAATKIFGSFARARELAGIHITKHKSPAQHVWDADAVVAAIRARHEEGEPIAVTKCPRSLVSAANRIFGGWRAAVEAAGLDYEKVLLRRDYSDGELLDWLRQLSLSNPSMTLYDLDRLGEHTVACRRRWGSLEQAAMAAGLSGWPVRVHHEAMSHEEITSDLRRLARAGEALNFGTVRQNPDRRRLVDGALKRYPSWDAAIAAAGLPPQRKIASAVRANPRRPRRRPS